MKGAQIGATESANNFIGYIIDNSPGPTLMVMPTDETVKRNSKIRIAPMIEATPNLRGKIATPKSRDGDNTVLQKSFPGGVLIMTGANSAVGLRSMPIRYLILDEVDGYPEDLDGEGSPIELAKKRTATFPKRKILGISTPTVDGVSAIQKQFLNTDQRRYFVPCPHCQHKQYFKFENLRWDKGKPESVLYFCEGCGVGIEERHKGTMLKEKGYGGLAEWIATVPELSTPRKAGYHLNSLYSPPGWYSWVDAARDWEDAQGDVTKIKTFTNTVLGECYVEEGEAPAWETLYNRRQQYAFNQPPVEVCFITVGVDVQADRIELEVVGWGKGKRSWSIDYRVITGSTSEQFVWEKLAMVVDETWVRSDGIVLPVRCMAVDSGYNTSQVYEFCRRFDPLRVFPVKGQDSQPVIVTTPRSVYYGKTGKKIPGVKLWNIGVSILKSEAYGFLKQVKADDGSTPKGYCEFPQYPQTYFRGLTAEQLQFRVDRKGKRNYEWVKKYERNEPLDCRIYARAAAAVFGIDRLTDEYYDTLAMEEAARRTEQKPKDKKRRSSFWG